MIGEIAIEGELFLAGVNLPCITGKAERMRDLHKITQYING